MTEVLVKTAATPPKASKYDEKLHKQVLEYLKSGAVDQTRLAKAINMSPAAVSQYLKLCYAGNIENIEAGLRKYMVLARGLEKHRRIKLDFAQTSVADKIFDTAKMCQYNGEIGVCYGASGLGKTTAVKELYKTCSGVILVDPNENSTSRAILKQVADGVKLGFYDPMPEDFIANIVKKLKDSGYIIIVDEAENLKPEVFTTLRKIHDRCENTCGLLFIGTERLHYNLTRLQGEYNYVINRVGFKVQLNSLEMKDIEILVKQIYPTATPEIIACFEKECKNNARVLANTLLRVNDIMQSNNAELCPEMIAAARRKLY